MNNLRNRVQLIGNLGKDPEIKTFENGTKMAKLTLATNETYKNQKGEKIDETQWHSCVIWGKQVDIANEFLKKGKEVCIDGKLNSRSYEDEKGDKKYVTEIIVNEFLMLGKK